MGTQRSLSTLISFDIIVQNLKINLFLLVSITWNGEHKTSLFTRLFGIATKKRKPEMDLYDHSDVIIHILLDISKRSPIAVITHSISDYTFSFVIDYIYVLRSET